MKDFSFSARSEKKLKTVKIELQHIARLALYLSPVDFAITEGIRTEERQKQLVAEGKSQTMKSRHLIGRAVDIVPYVGGKYVWDNDDAWKLISAAFLTAAKILGETIQWGGAWQSFRDFPHFQLES